MGSCRARPPHRRLRSSARRRDDHCFRRCDLLHHLSTSATLTLELRSIGAERGLGRPAEHGRPGLGRGRRETRSESGAHSSSGSAVWLRSPGELGGRVALPCRMRRSREGKGVRRVRGGSDDFAHKAKGVLGRITEGGPGSSPLLLLRSKTKPRFVLSSRRLEAQGWTSARRLSFLFLQRELVHTWYQYQQIKLSEKGRPKNSRKS